MNILNQCIFQWAVLNPEQVAVAKAAALAKDLDWAADYDFSTLGLGCAGQLARTQSLIASDAFSSNLDAVLNAAKAKLATGLVISQEISHHLQVTNKGTQRHDILYGV